MINSPAVKYFKDNKHEAYFECSREEMVNYVPEDARTVLEIGCGVGSFGRLVKQRQNVEFWGVEVDPVAAERASICLDRVKIGLFPDGVELPEKYFDCVVFNDVLEHMIDPWSALRIAKDYLTSSGHVVASVPNIRYLPTLYRLIVRGEWTYTQTGVLDRTHLRFFTKKSMLEMFNEAGYKVSRINGIYAYNIWQIPILELLLPRFIGETKYINYAILACPKRGNVEHN